MKTEHTNTTDKLWRAEPWPEDITAQLPRPSGDVRNRIYAAARNRVSQAPRQGVAARLALLFRRGRLSYAAWGILAPVLIAVCVWLGTAGRGTSRIAAGDEAELNEMVSVVASIVDEPDFSPLTEQSGVDIDDCIFVVELQTVHEALACLENEMQGDYMLQN